MLRNRRPSTFTCRRARMRSAAIKGRPGAAALRRNTERLSGAGVLQRDATRRTKTNTNYEVILLSCDFLSFPSLHQEFRGQEDLSAVTERIMGVGIPLAVITALRQHPVRSLSLSLPPSFFLILCLSVSSLSCPLTD